MPKSYRWRAPMALAMTAGAVAGLTALPGSSIAARQAHRADDQIKHVLLISVDGMHQHDLAWYVQTHPNSVLAQLTKRGIEYTNAHTVVPSDSDPGGTALMTGGDPRATGVYYDVEYNHDLYPAGTTNCTGPTGANVIYDSPDDLNDNSLDAGQGLSGLPGSILDMTGDPTTLLNGATFPVDPKTCKPIYPHSYLKVNTIFEVAKAAGLRTAWSDKHPVYESFNGPSGDGIDDLFTPEIDSTALLPNGQPWPGDISWTGNNGATRQYDGYKVQAIINEINGYDHSGREKVGTPAIFGMNFQTVSTAEKLKSSSITPDGPVYPGGYLPGTVTPGPLLASALDWVNDQLGRLVATIQANGLADSTAIIITAKHGQSPLDPDELKRINDAPIIEAINHAWTAKTGEGPLIVAGTDDDVWQSYLSDRSQDAAAFVKAYLWDHSAPAVTYSGATIEVPHSGLAQIWAGADSALFFGVGIDEPGHPDVFGRVQTGVVYTTGSKIAEHGGSNAGDRDVPILLVAPGLAHQVSDAWVETTQVAPTILQLLGLEPGALKAVQEEHTAVLPGS